MAPLDISTFPAGSTESQIGVRMSGLHLQIARLIRRRFQLRSDVRDSLLLTFDQNSEATGLLQYLPILDARDSVHIWKHDYIKQTYLYTHSRFELASFEHARQAPRDRSEHRF